MNIVIWQEVWASKLTATQKLVALALVFHGDETGALSVPLTKIGGWTGLNPRTVKRVLGQLAALGWVRREKRQDATGRRLPNLYRLWPPHQQGALPLGLCAPPPGTEDPPVMERN